MLSSVAAFLLLIIALLAIPLTLTFRVSWRQDLQGQIRLQWAFGLVRLRFPLSPSESPSPEGEEPARKTGSSDRPPRKKRNPLPAIRQQAFRRRIIRFISGLWHAVYKRDVNLHMRIGLGDPADTGQLWAFMGPVSGMLANIEEAAIDIEPDFLDSAFELDGSGTVRIIPLQLIYLAAGLLLSPPVWRGIRQMRATG